MRVCGIEGLRPQVLAGPVGRVREGWNPRAVSSAWLRRHQHDKDEERIVDGAAAQTVRRVSAGNSRIRRRNRRLPTAHGSPVQCSAFGLHLTVGESQPHTEDNVEYPQPTDQEGTVRVGHQLKWIRRETADQIKKLFLTKSLKFPLI